MAEEIAKGAVLEEDVEVENDQYLIFRIEGQEFGIQAMRVQEIATVLPITKVPNTPYHIEGIMNLRGKLASVLNFRKMFSFADRAYDEDTRIIVVEYDVYPVGLVVDSVEEVIKIPDDIVHTLPEATSKAIAEEFIRGVGILDKRLVILLSIDRIIGELESLNTDIMKKAIEDVKNGKLTMATDTPQDSTLPELEQKKATKEKEAKTNG